MNRKTKFLIVFLAIVFVSFGLYKIFPKSISAPNEIPQSFIDANQKGSLIAQKITDFATDASQKLQKINYLDQKGNYIEALNLTSQAFDKNLEMRNEAVNLANELDIMARALPQIALMNAREIAFESINDRLALINKLINYSDYLNQLLLNLRLRFANQNVDRAEIEKLVQQLNAEIASINALNNQASEEMDRFMKIAR